MFQKLVADEHKQTADLERLLHVRCLRVDALIQINDWRCESGVIAASDTQNGSPPFAVVNKESFGVEADQICHVHVSAQDGTADKPDRGSNLTLHVPRC